MSVVGELVGVIACVAAIVSAYKDGAEVIRGIKDKRKKGRGHPPTDELENSLNRGARAVEEAQQDGLKKFGVAFQYGDGKDGHCFSSLSLRCCSTSAASVTAYCHAPTAVHAQRTESSKV